MEAPSSRAFSWFTIQDQGGIGHLPGLLPDIPTSPSDLLPAVLGIQMEMVKK